MKNYLAPVILLVLAIGLVVYLLLDVSGEKISFDADAYLSARGRIDSLEVELFEARGQEEAEFAIRNELDSAWTSLNEMRMGDAHAPEVTEEGNLSDDTWTWILGGLAAVIACVAFLILALGHRQKVLTQKMEALKTAEMRFKEPKSGFENDPTIAVPRARPPKRSIIDEVSEYAETQKRVRSDNVSEEGGQKVVFEDENGVPENKILTTDLDAVHPQLRPTAKERITSAMQSLSNALHSPPRGMSREYTMRLRTQSHNVTGVPKLQEASPMETSRFERENSAKSKILQMSRRGFPASAIATQLKVPQDQVESVIKEALESGS